MKQVDLKSMSAPFSHVPPPPHTHTHTEEPQTDDLLPKAQSHTISTTRSTVTPNAHIAKYVTHEHTTNL